MAKRRWRPRRERRAELDLAHDRPSPALHEAQIEFLDRVHVSSTFGVDGVETQFEIQVKGRLHRVAEHFILCVCTMLVASVTATLCDLVAAPLWLVLTASAVAGVLSFVTGYRHIAKPPVPASPTTRT